MLTTKQLEKIVERALLATPWGIQALEKAKYAISWGRENSQQWAIDEGENVIQQVKDRVDDRDILRSPSYRRIVTLWMK